MMNRLFNSEKICIFPILKLFYGLCVHNSTIPDSSTYSFVDTKRRHYTSIPLIAFACAERVYYTA